jgi:hypothetical protein
MAYNCKPKVPKGMMEWPERETGLAVDEIVAKYTQGYRGCIYDEVARELLLSEMDEPDGEKVAYDYGFANGAQDGLVMLWLPAQKHWNVWPKPGQQTGDCTSHAGANIGIVTIGLDVINAAPDEVTGFLETWPDLSETAIRNGVIAFEPIYGDRGHRGQGASCDTLIRHVIKTGGITLRKNYDGIVNLEKVNTNLAISWGGSGTPDNVRAIGREHQIRTATDCRGWKNAKDFVFRGYPLWSCSGLGWSSKRDEWGYSKQQGGWSHSWVVDGWDARPETVERYGFELFHYNHDWGKWNSGPRKVHGTNEEIPEGSFWADARLLDRCDLTAMASINGWAQRTLPKFHVEGIF